VPGEVRRVVDFDAVVDRLVQHLAEPESV
jgi:hypothetical protein